MFTVTFWTSLLVRMILPVPSVGARDLSSSPLQCSVSVVYLQDPRCLVVARQLCEEVKWYNLVDRKLGTSGIHVTLQLSEVTKITVPAHCHKKGC